MNTFINYEDIINNIASCSHEELKEIYQSIQDIDSEDPLLYLLKWIILLNLQNNIGAIQFLNKSLELDRNWSTTYFYKWLAFINLFEEKWSYEEFIFLRDEALKAYDEWLQINPEDIDIMHNRINILFQSNNQNAINELRKLISIVGIEYDKCVYQIMLSQKLLYLNKYKEALEELTNLYTVWKTEYNLPKNYAGVFIHNKKEISEKIQYCRDQISLSS